MLKYAKERIPIPIINLKILSLVLLAVLGAVCLSSGIMRYYINTVLRTQKISDDSSVMNKLTQKVDVFFEDIENYSTNLMLNDQLQQMVKNRETYEGARYFENIRDIKTFLRYYVLLRDNVVDDIYVICSDSTIIYNRLANYDTGKSWYQDFIAGKRTKGFSSEVQSTSFGMLPGEHDVISYITNIVDKNDIGHKYGNLVVNIKYDYFLSLINAENPSMPYLLLVNEKKQPIRSTRASGELDALYGECVSLYGDSGFKDGTYVNGNYYFCRTLQDQGWILFGVLPASRVDEELSKINFVLFMIILMSFIISVLVFLPIIYKITNPLNTLVHGMKKVSAGKLDTNIEVRTRDELKEMADVFNKMVGDISNHINEAVRQEKKERELQMKLFMAQINPHFICNTLNTIIYQAQSINAKDIVTVTKAFISILQVTMNIDRNMNASIREEIQYIDNYLLIICYRYGDLVGINWDVDEELLDIVINRMLLYPIIENSVFHGIIPKGGAGNVSVSIKKEQGYIKFAVTDDGIGMSGETLKKVWDRINGAAFEGRASIGLQNVNRRLLFSCGPECGLTICSEYGQGTKISFVIPYDTASGKKL